MTTPITVQKLFARESSSPKNASLVYEATEDQITSLAQSQSGFPNDLSGIPRVLLFDTHRDGILGATLLARESSSPKNATMSFEASDDLVATMSYECGDETNGTEDNAHMWGDENHNARSDQKHRGGIAG